MALLVHPESY
jgi:hypothetical protein